MATWKVDKNGEQIDASLEQIREWLDRGEINKYTQIFIEGSANWVNLGTVIHRLPEKRQGEPELNGRNSVRLQRAVAPPVTATVPHGRESEVRPNVSVERWTGSGYSLARLLGIALTSLGLIGCAFGLIFLLVGFGGKGGDLDKYMNVAAGLFVFISGLIVGAMGQLISAVVHAASGIKAIQSDLRSWIARANG